MVRFHTEQPSLCRECPYSACLLGVLSVGPNFTTQWAHNRLKTKGRCWFMCRSRDMRVCSAVRLQISLIERDFKVSCGVYTAEAGRQAEFWIQTSRREWRFGAKSEDEASAWIDAIQKAIDEHSPDSERYPQTHSNHPAT